MEELASRTLASNQQSNDLTGNGQMGRGSFKGEDTKALSGVFSLLEMAEGQNRENSINLEDTQQA
jgi:hypothetical protein